MKRAILIDDHPVVQIGVKAFIERNRLFNETLIAGTGKQAMELVKSCKDEGGHFDLAIMDINLPDVEIISLVKYVIEHLPKTPILMFSMEPPKAYARRLIDLGVKGFIDKTTPDDEFLFAINSILQGRSYFSSEVLMESLNDSTMMDQEGNIQSLSNREAEILGLMVRGKNSQEISSLLDLHKSSVATYRSRVFKKLGVNNNFDLYRWALREGLIYP